MSIRITGHKQRDGTDMKPTRDVHFILYVMSDKITLASICIIHDDTVSLYNSTLSTA